MILADGGERSASINSSWGSGGAIRLLANRISGNGRLLARGRVSPDRGYGRILVESPDLGLFHSTSVPLMTTLSTVGPVFPPATAPTLRVTQVAAANVGVDPDGNILSTDLQIDDSGAVSIAIEATDIPVGTTVEVRVVPARGPVITATSTPLVDVGGVLTATADVTLPTGRSVIQLKANWTP